MEQQNFKLIAGLVVVAIVGYVAYKKFSKSYDNIVFQGEIFEHIEEVSPNEQVHTHMFTIGGKEVGDDTDQWIQITNLGPKVTNAQRDQVDQQIKSTMQVRPVPGSSDRLFGVMMGQIAVYVLMLESTYVLYMRNVPGADYETLLGESDSLFEELELIPSDNL